MSEDGLHGVACTNIKTLFDEIIEIGYKTQTVSVSGFKEIPFNYNNLVKCIRFAQGQNRYFVATIDCEGAQININELGLISKSR